MIRTLIVEDDPLLAEAHSTFTARVAGFGVVGVAHQGAEALRLLATVDIDLVLLDFYLPDMTGLDVCRRLRGRGQAVDVIAVTSARDLSMVRGAVSLGVVQYLLKPFSFASFRDKLEAYAEYRRRTTDAATPLGQAEVDQAFAALRRPGSESLPKGLGADTLAAVVQVLRPVQEHTVSEIAAAVGISRPTARRYLDYLTTQRLVSRTPRYGRAGRPENAYLWQGGS